MLFTCHRRRSEGVGDWRQPRLDFIFTCHWLKKPVRWHRHWPMFERYSLHATGTCISQAALASTTATISILIDFTWLNRPSQAQCIVWQFKDTFKSVGYTTLALATTDHLTLLAGFSQPKHISKVLGLLSLILWGSKFKGCASLPHSMFSWVSLFQVFLLLLGWHFSTQLSSYICSRWPYQYSHHLHTASDVSYVWHSSQDTYTVCTLT